MTTCKAFLARQTTLTAPDPLNQGIVVASQPLFKFALGHAFLLSFARQLGNHATQRQHVRPMRTADR